MRELYDTTGPGKYEGEPPMVAFLDARSEWADAQSGDVEAPTGYFAQFGKWLLRWDDRGFISGHKYPNIDQVYKAFNILDNQYCDWADEREEDDEGEED